MNVRRLSAAALALLAGFLLALPCRAADSPRPVLPRQFGSWTLTGAQEVASASLSSTLGEDFPVLVESGLTSAYRGSYQRSGAGASGTMPAVLFRFRDASGAYGAYTFLRTPDMYSSDLTEKCAIGHDRILAVAGNLLLDVSEPGAASLAELKMLVTEIQKQTQPGSYPTLWQYLPGTGLERNSDHYVLGPAGLSKVFPLKTGDWLGLGQGTEAESGRYHLGRDNPTLLLAVYPTPQLARLKLQELVSTFGAKTLDQSPPDASGTQTTTLVPPPSANETVGAPADPPLYAERNGLMVAVVSGARDARTARTLIDRITYRTSVTWNEPSWEAKEPPFLVMIVNILIGTLLLLLYAFVAGLVFAGIRLLVKRLFPGRVFDRDTDVELIQLGLGSKPIEAKDFLSLRPRD